MEICCRPRIRGDFHSILLNKIAYIFLQYSLNLLKHRVESKDPVFENYWKIMQTDPELTTPDIASAMQRLSEPGTFFMASKPRVVAEVSTNIRKVLIKVLFIFN